MFSVADQIRKVQTKQRDQTQPDGERILTAFRLKLLTPTKVHDYTRHCRPNIRFVYNTEYVFVTRGVRTKTRSGIFFFWGGGGRRYFKGYVYCIYLGRVTASRSYTRVTNYTRIIRATILHGRATPA